MAPNAFDPSTKIPWPQRDQEAILAKSWVGWHGDGTTNSKLSKISIDFPLFLSPHSTGCSRYVSATFLDDGSLLGSWQQAQGDGSQPLVSNHLGKSEVSRILGG